jgi:hypothetical protein
MASEFVPYIGEGQMTSRDILNDVRRLIWLGDLAMDYPDFADSEAHQQIAASFFAQARSIALEFIANSGHGDINTVHRLAKLCQAPKFTPPTDPYARNKNR